MTCRRPTDLHVTALRQSSSRGRVRIGHWSVPCALGKGGLRARKREGDGATPIGRWPIRQILYRDDRRRCISQPPNVIAKRIETDLGWCDAIDDGNYNRMIRHPYPASAERLWRNDHLYDVVVVLGYNDVPRIRGRGSAIFLHLADEDGGGNLLPTAGCVALRRRDISLVLSQLHRISHVHVHQ